jgi:hypothetical protein
MAKAENEIAPRDRTYTFRSAFEYSVKLVVEHEGRAAIPEYVRQHRSYQIVLEAVRNLPIRRDRTEVAENIAFGLSLHVGLMRCYNRSQEQARKLWPAALKVIGKLSAYSLRNNLPRDAAQVRKSALAIVNEVDKLARIIELLFDDENRAEGVRHARGIRNAASALLRGANKLAGVLELSPPDVLAHVLRKNQPLEAQPFPKLQAPSRKDKRMADWLTILAASAYKRLTGKRAGRKAVRFQELLKKLFEIAGISASADECTRRMLIRVGERGQDFV